MSDELPQGWVLARLEDLTENYRQDIVDGPFGSNLKASEYVDKGVPIVRLQNIDRNRFLDKNIKCVTPLKAEELSRHSFLAGDIIITKLGDPVGKACVVPRYLENGIIVADVVRARINENRALKKYVVYAINSPIVVSIINLKVKGSTRPRVNLGDIRELEIPLAPQSEQRRIVAKLEKLLAKVDACKERLEKIPAILKRFRQSVLAAACSGRLTADWRELHCSVDNWKTVKLSEVTHSRLGKMLDKAKNQGNPTPYLRNINVRWFSFDLKDIQMIKVTEQEAKALSLHPDDVLVCEGGEPGRCAIWKGESGAFVYQKALHRIRVGPELAPEWVCYSLKSAADSGQLMDLFTGTTIKHLTGISLGEFQLDLPPIEEQQEIVRRVEALFKIADDIEARYEKAKAHVGKLTQSILAKAFRGELVPQDPNDEPASELLKRIQEECRKQEAEGRPGRKSARRRVKN